MAIYALAQCTAWLIFTHQQKQGHQRAGFSNCDGEEGMCEDWSVYCMLADLRMEGCVKGDWCICVCIWLALSGIDLLYCSTFMRSCHSCSQGCMVRSLVVHGRLHTEPSHRCLWRRQIWFSRKEVVDHGGCVVHVHCTLTHYHHCETRAS